MSLTKAILLKEAAISKPEVLGEFFGETVYVKSISEFQRSRRMSSMYDMKKDKMREDALQRARVLTIIDHVCDKDGKNLFTEKDAEAIKNLDAMKLDGLISAIEDWAAGKEGKPEGK